MRKLNHNLTPTRRTVTMWGHVPHVVRIEGNPPAKVLVNYTRLQHELAGLGIGPLGWHEPGTEGPRREVTHG